MNKIPENAWMKLTFCAISDSTGLTAAIIVEGRLTIDEDELFARSSKLACQTLNDLFHCDDARPMTAKEVKDYMDSTDDLGSPDPFDIENYEGN